MKRILILGGSGNFGKRIATALVRAGLQIIIAGRDMNKLQAVFNTLSTAYPNCNVHPAAFDVKNNLTTELQALKPTVVINRLIAKRIKIENKYKSS